MVWSSAALLTPALSPLLQQDMLSRISSGCGSGHPCHDDGLCTTSHLSSWCCYPQQGTYDQIQLLKLLMLLQVVLYPCTVASSVGKVSFCQSVYRVIESCLLQHTVPGVTNKTYGCACLPSSCTSLVSTNDQLLV